MLSDVVKLSLAGAHEAAPSSPEPHSSPISSSTPLYFPLRPLRPTSGTSPYFYVEGFENPSSLPSLLLIIVKSQAVSLAVGAFSALPLSTSPIERAPALLS